MSAFRQHAHEPYGGGQNFFSLMAPTPVVKILLIGTICAFVLQIIASRWWGDLAVQGLLGLNVYFFKHVKLWQIVTYMFMHGGFWHLFSNMIGLFFFGPHIERAFGQRRFLEFYVVAGVAAGLGWLVLDLAGAVLLGTPHVPCIGASGAVLGVVAAFGTLYPQQRVTVFLYFIPITMTAKTLVIGYAALTVFLLVTQEGGNVAHTAHLFGLLTGYFYTKKFARDDARGLTLRSHGVFDDWIARFRKKRIRIVRTPPPETPLTEADLNRILEKISSKGMQSLTREERQTLERASNQEGPSRP